MDVKKKILQCQIDLSFVHVRASVVFLPLLLAINFSASPAKFQNRLGIEGILLMLRETLAQKKTF